MIVHDYDIITIHMNIIIIRTVASTYWGARDGLGCGEIPLCKIREDFHAHESALHNRAPRVVVADHTHKGTARKRSG